MGEERRIQSITVRSYIEERMLKDVLDYEVRPIPSKSAMDAIYAALGEKVL